MKVISFIDEDEVIEKILRHCKVMERVCPTPAADRNHRAAGSGGAILGFDNYAPRHLYFF
jgi:hypothetical protein